MEKTKKRKPRIVIEIDTKAEHAGYKRHVKALTPPRDLRTWVLGLMRQEVGLAMDHARSLKVERGA